MTNRVKELTNVQQSPVSITPSGITDFPIVTVGRSRCFEVREYTKLGGAAWYRKSAEMEAK